MSPWGYLLFTGWASLVAVLANRWWWLLGLAALEVTFGLLWSRDGLRLLRRPRFWTFILATAAVGPFLIGQPDAATGPLSLSWEGLGVGLTMSGRALGLTLAISLGVAALSLSDVVAIFERVGLRGLGFAIALAMNLLTTLQDMATVTLQTVRLRGGLRRPWVSLRLFLVTTMANTLRYGDEVVNAATVRAFDPNRGPPRSLPVRQLDVILLLVLAGLTGAILISGAW